MSDSRIYVLRCRTGFLVVADDEPAEEAIHCVTAEEIGKAVISASARSKLKDYRPKEPEQLDLFPDTNPVLVSLPGCKSTIDLTK